MVVKPLQPTKEKTVGVRSKLLGKGTSFSQAFFFNKKIIFYSGFYRSFAPIKSITPNAIVDSSNKSYQHDSQIISVEWFLYCHKN